MRSIQVSTEVYARIWGHRLDGEESEDAILRRLLAVAPTFEGASSMAPMSRTLWRDDVWNALESLGGEAPLVAIYEKVREIRRAAHRRLPRSLEAIVRRELEYNSSDSESYTGKFNWFRSVKGIGHGIWGLRKRKL